MRGEDVLPVWKYHWCVLILVLMEDALRATRNERKRTRQAVLILVLMEDALRVLLVATTTTV